MNECFRGAFIWNSTGKYFFLMAKFSMKDIKNSHHYFLNFHALDPLAWADSKLILKELTFSAIIIVVNLWGRKVIQLPSTFLSISVVWEKK
jgi:hypothetical protein